ncbi:MAG: helix-turn-helix domain-containing protein [Myxococcales bacterium]|jgi:DNA-binding HxlR family transcriptional regulator
MAGYGQFCSVAMALDVVGERWTLLIVRELISGSHRFADVLRGVPRMSRTLLSRRLRSLRDAGLVERREVDGGHEYHLTEAGRALEPVVMSLGIWGQRFAHDHLAEEHLDPELLMWDLQRRLDVSALPARPTVVQFWFRDAPTKRSRFWLRLERPAVELCVNNPGLHVDLKVETCCRTMVEVWTCRRDLQAALRCGEVELDGPRELREAFPRWLLLNVFAAYAERG